MTATHASNASLEKLFAAYRGLVDRGAEPAQKEDLAREICLELSIHTRTVEHATAEDLIAEVECMSPEDERYDTKVIVLGELSPWR